MMADHCIPDPLVDGEMKKGSNLDAAATVLAELFTKELTVLLYSTGLSYTHGPKLWRSAKQARAP